jgi:deoxyribodipyrimidine photo-lyase
VSLAAPERLRALNDRPVRGAGRYVLYWMTAFRRTRFNAALEHAVARARELAKPLLVLEALRVGYEHACDRFHAFVLHGMADNARAFARRGVTYHPYVEPRADAGKGLLAELAEHAALVVADDWPGFFQPQLLAAAARRVPVRLEAVDGCGLLPLSVAGKVHVSAYHLRRRLQKELPTWLERLPAEDPLAGGGLKGATLPAGVATRWPAASARLLAAQPGALAALPIDHEVGPVALVGGERAGGRVLARFLDARLERYGDRNEPSAEVTSGLSPWLHFGHVAPHEAVRAVLERERWTPDRLARKADGRREGWWGLSPAAEGFLDQIVTWREVGFAAARFGPPPSMAALPAWAQRTLAEHASDPRAPCYSLARFEQARTHDPLWNAAQRQLLREGVLHNYLRMLWGKKILEWSATPEEALSVMLILNDRYAVDGRDPNSACGILWVLGRFDRPWPPERPILGTVRPMSSTNTARKVDVTSYLARHAEVPGAGGPNVPVPRAPARPRPR